MDERIAGTYAEERYRATLRNYRRRMRPYTVGLLASGLSIFLAVQILHGLDWWSFIAGLVVSAFCTLATWVHDEPPEFVAKWKRGADGERRTAKAIAPLLAEGWKMRHDVELRRGNADHVLLSPDGVAYVLETKTLAGTVSVEHDRLVQRFTDDPEATRRIDVRAQVERVADDVAAKWHQHGGKPAPPLRPVVVIWGSFPQGSVARCNVSYVSGEKLPSFLRAQD
jgi:hypothetical protein